MNPDFPDLQQSYDRVAAAYAARVFDELAQKPLDRALLERFAAHVRPLGPACDLGCGPGHVGRFLRECGLRVLGVDPSAGMLAQARRLQPELPLVQGGMPDLPFADGVLGGIAAFYSIIHLPRASQPRAFAEMRRVLCAGGALLIGFHIGDADVHLGEWWETPVSLDFLFFQRAEIERRLRDAGFQIEESIEREPYADVEVATRRGYILARAP